VSKNIKNTQQLGGTKNHYEHTTRKWGTPLKMYNKEALNTTLKTHIEQMMKNITSAQQRRRQKTLRTHNKDLLKRIINAQQASTEKHREHITSKH
jgi:hypothetical protein